MIAFALPAAVVVGGLIAIAALLFALQRLRARRRIVYLPAAMLWAQAQASLPMRDAGGRFRYWLAYLLALAIAACLWLAVGQPHWSRTASAQETTVFFLDNSAVLSAPGQLAAARAALLADLRAIPAGARSVTLGDAAATVLLRPGESVSLLARRLDAVEAGARPSRFAEWLRDRGGEREGGSVAYRYYGAWPAARAARAAAGAGVRVVPGYLSPAVPDNRGIVALGATPAASGRSDAADVVVGLAGAALPGAGDVAIRIDGVAVAAERITATGPGRLLLREVPADGKRLTVTLRRGDGFPADDRAEMILPDRRTIAVAVGPGVPRPVIDALRADRGVRLTDDADAQVVVRSGGPAAADRPALTITAPGAGGATFAFAGPGEGAGDAAADRLGDLGLEDVDAGLIADRAGRPVAVTGAEAERRGIAVWDALFDPAGGFVDSPALPVFVSRSVRWLSGQAGWTPYAAAGEPMPAPVAGTALATPGGDPLEARSVPIDAGDAAAGDNRAGLSLIDPATTADAADSVAAPPVVPLGAGVPDPLVMLLLAAALLLLAGEWLLLRRGWMP